MDKLSKPKKSRATPHQPIFNKQSLVYKGVRFDVHSLQIQGKSGKMIQRDAVVHPGAVVILPLLDNDKIVMIRNHRFAVGAELWELPAGTLETKEEPVETAHRELIEETGYAADKMEAMTIFYTTPGFCNEVMHAYLAKDLTMVGQALEDNEEIVVKPVSLYKALEMIRNGTIRDAKTIAALLYYHTFLLFA
jgi:ADP-ribose pyrophosphatase